MLWTIIVTLVGGIIIGSLGKLLAPGHRDNIPFWLTVVCGVVGMLVGSWVYYAIFGLSGPAQHYMDANDDIARDPCRLGMVDLLKHGDTCGSIDQAAAHYDAQPGVHAMLASHDLTAREMVLGMMTLTGAAMQDLRRQHPQAMAEGGMPVSAANMAFYEAHKAQLHQHMQAVAREQLKAHGGKLPACLSE